MWCVLPSPLFLWGDLPLHPPTPNIENKDKRPFICRCYSSLTKGVGQIKWIGIIYKAKKVISDMIRMCAPPCKVVHMAAPSHAYLYCLLCSASLPSVISQHPKQLSQQSENN